jgi:hypothetical protein
VLHALPISPSFADYSNYTKRTVLVMKLSICSFLHTPVTSSLFGLNILGTLFTNTLELCLMSETNVHTHSYLQYQISS